AVHLVAAPADLDAAGDLLARRQRVAHALGAHADAVRAGRKAPGLRHAARLLDGRHRAVDQGTDAGIARVHGRMAVRDADNRLAEIRRREADRIEHGAIGRARVAFGDHARAFVEGHELLLGVTVAAAVGPRRPSSAHVLIANRGPVRPEHAL